MLKEKKKETKNEQSVENETTSTDGARIGVFICHCGTNIGGVVDVPALVEYAKTLDDVVYAEENLYTCSEDGIVSIKRKIGEENLNRVIVASCTPRTHQPLFQQACEEAGLNKYLFEFVNIRDQCSWIHMKQPERATEKAKNLVRMGVAKARLLQPFEDITSPVNPKTLVIGGGVAGMSAALNIARQGFDVHLVERAPELGGMLRELKSLFPDFTDSHELISKLRQQIENESKISTYLNTDVADVTGYIGNFTATLKNVTGSNGQKSVDIGTIIVATGAEPKIPEQGQFGYGDYDNVLTQKDFEQQLSELVPKAKRIAMIQCVGTRIPERTYCSRICCMTAIKNAIKVKELNPDCKVYIFNRGIMSFGREFELMYRESMEKNVRFVRYEVATPPEPVPEPVPEQGSEKKLKGINVKMSLIGSEKLFETDYLVLSTPLIPQADSERIAKMLKVPRTKDGFFLEAHVKLNPVEFATDGIYLCGCAKWPTNVADAISQGFAAAGKAVIPMRQGFVKAEGITAVVDQESCVACGNCVASCPYTAITLEHNEELNKMAAVVNVAKCKGCGTCIASCPSASIEQRGFTDNQLLDMINALAQEATGALEVESVEEVA